MRILFIGDVVGRSGRDALAKHMPDIVKNFSPDVKIVNVDNAAHGFGVTSKICEELFAMGFDCLTGGNHIWDQREIIPFIDREPRLLRTCNYPSGVPGNGHYLHTLSNGQKILIIHVMGCLFMDTLDNPFHAVDEILKKYTLGVNVDSIFVDVHAEATSEKMALAHYLDGRVSAVVGTHTHMPTADLQILPKGTAYQTDAGMTGDYNTVIGMKAEVPIIRFTRKFSVEKLSPGEGEGTVCGVMIDTDSKTGRAVKIEPLRLGPRLANTHHFG